MRGKRRTWYLDHRTDLIVDGVAVFAKDLLNRSFDDFLLIFKLIDNTRKRNHNFRNSRDAFFFQFEGCFHDCAGLHFGDFGIEIAEAATAKAQHGICFQKALYAFVDVFIRYIHDARHLHLSFLIVRNEFVQRRIEQAHRHRIAVHSGENTFEVLLLKGK